MRAIGLANSANSQDQDPIPTDGLWTSRSPVPLPLSPVPGQHNFPAPNRPSSPIFPRSNFGLCANKSGDVYFYGGITYGGRQDELYRYSVTDHTVTPLQCCGTSPNGRSRHAMALVGDVIIIHGGSCGESVDPDLYTLNLVSREWSKIATPSDGPGPLRLHAIAVVSMTIYIFGGSICDGYSDKLWAFDMDGSESKCELVEPSSQIRPVARGASTLVAYQDRLILCGGWTDSGSLNDVWSFDQKSRTWSELQCSGDIFPRRYGHSAATVDDVMYIIGGSEGPLSAPSKDIFAFKVTDKQWFKLKSFTDATPAPRLHHASTCIGTKIFTFGGNLEGASEEHPIHVFDTKYIDNPGLHAPERLKELDSEFRVRLISAKRRGKDKYEPEMSKWRGKDEPKISKGRGKAEYESKMSKRVQIISHILQYPPEMDSLVRLTRPDAQVVVDLLADELERLDILHSNADRRHVLYLLSKLAKFSQVFPKHTELSGVQCDFTWPVNQEGGHDAIYKGTFRSQVVCVKATRTIGHGARYNQMIRAQVGELILLAHASHPNVIPLYGAYRSSEEIPRICIVSPWMENGDLAAYLRKFPNTPKIPLMCDMAAGLDFMHDMGIIHADLKARNVLVSQSQRAVLGDLGIATVLHTNVGTTTAGDFGGTTYWMAPELLAAEDVYPPTKESDMWGFACVLYEMCIGEIPFVRYYNPAQLVKAFIKGHPITPLRPKQGMNPIGASGEAWVPLAERCWNHNPSDRPTAAEAFQDLTALNVQDDRPPMDNEFAVFEAVKSNRAKVEIDYTHVLSIVEKPAAYRASALAKNGRPRKLRNQN